MKDRLHEKVTSAFSELINNDGVLFKCKIEDVPEDNPRKLHEVCINHKLANYLEDFIVPLLKDKDDKYYVDIEFNKEGPNDKWLEIDGDLAPARPDIIIHNRKSGAEKLNFLVVECKKKGSSKKLLNHDHKKIQAFMNEDSYKYEFGLQVIYAKDSVRGTLYYKVNETIETEGIKSR